MLYMQAALDAAAVLEAEAHRAGQQRPGLTAHRDSLIAYQKLAQDATPNPYWEDPEGFVEAALQRMAAERNARSPSAPAAPKSAQPQPEMQAAQVRLLNSLHPAEWTWLPCDVHACAQQAVS